MKMHSPSTIVASLGFVLLLDFARFPFELEDDLVTARGPVPPASTGFPTPSFVCSSLALRVRGGGIGGGEGGLSDSGCSE